MICPKCSFEQEDGRNECAKCGLVFEKYSRRRTLTLEPEEPPPQEEGGAPEQKISVRDLLFEVEGLSPTYTLSGLLVRMSLGSIALCGQRVRREPQS